MRAVGRSRAVPGDRVGRGSIFGTEVGAVELDAGYSHVSEAMAETVVRTAEKRRVPACLRMSRRVVTGRGWRPSHGICPGAGKAANADETGWRQGNSDGNNPTQRKAWLWVMITSWVTVFQVHLSRGQAAARELLSEFAGYLITDRWTG